MGLLKNIINTVSGGSILSAGAGIASALIGGNQQAKAQREANQTNLKINRENNEANLSLAKQQNAWNREQLQMQNEYNSAAAQKQRLLAAGLNPMLAYGSVSAGEQADLESAPLANQQSTQVIPEDGLGLGIQQAGMNVQTAVSQAQNAKALRQKDRELDIQEKTADSNISLNEKRMSEISANIRQIEQNISESQVRCKEIAANIDFLKASQKEKALRSINHEMQNELFGKYGEQRYIAEINKLLADTSYTKAQKDYLSKKYWLELESLKQGWKRLSLEERHVTLQEKMSSWQALVLGSEADLNYKQIQHLGNQDEKFSVETEYLRSQNEMTQKELKYYWINKTLDIVKTGVQAGATIYGLGKFGGAINKGAQSVPAPSVGYPSTETYY